MGSFERISKEKYEEFKRYGIGHAEQAGVSKAPNEKSLSKELKEDSFAKADMMELLADRLVGQLSLPENYKIIDEAIKEEGAAQKLADELWEYNEKLGSKKIMPDNEAKDFIRNSAVSLMGFVERAKKNKLSDEGKEAIISEFSFIKEYLKLLREHNEFENAELGKKLGFLENKIDKRKLEFLRTKKQEYIEKCKELLEKI